MNLLGIACSDWQSYIVFILNAREQTTTSKSGNGFNLPGILSARNPEMYHAKYAVALLVSSLHAFRQRNSSICNESPLNVIHTFNLSIWPVYLFAAMRKSVEIIRNFLTEFHLFEGVAADTCWHHRQRLNINLYRWMITRMRANSRDWFLHRLPCRYTRARIGMSAVSVRKIGHN